MNILLCIQQVAFSHNYFGIFFEKVIVLENDFELTLGSREKLIIIVLVKLNIRMSFRPLCYFVRRILLILILKLQISYLK